MQPLTPGAIVDALNPAAQAAVLASAVGAVGGSTLDPPKNVAGNIGLLAEEMTSAQQVQTLLAMAGVLGDAGTPAADEPPKMGRVLITARRRAEGSQALSLTDAEQEALHATLVEQIADKLADVPLACLCNMMPGLDALDGRKRPTAVVFTPVAPEIAEALVRANEFGLRPDRILEAAALYYSEADREARLQWAEAVGVRFYPQAPIRQAPVDAETPTA